MKKKVLFFLLFVTALLPTGCRNTGVSTRPSNLPVRYDNAQYGLTFFLPADWQGYSVSIRQVEDQTYSPSEGRQMTVEYTPMITLRHPQWQADTPYQDIPILVFTHAQWDALQHDKLWPSIFAGGMMRELWHNGNYLFAMSNRTFGFNDELKDWKETQDVVKQNCDLHPMPLLYPLRR